MMRMILLLAIVVATATSTEVFISDVVDVKIDDVNTKKDVLSNDKVAENEIPSVDEVPFIQEDVNFNKSQHQKC